MKRRAVWTMALLLGLALLLALSPLVTEALTRSERQKIMKTAVQIIAASQDSQGKLRSKWSGSGTMISADGLILTNCHVAMPRAMWNDPYYDYDVLVVAVTNRSDEPPTPTFLAEVSQYNPALDLAVIRLTGYLDGRPFNASRLNLPFLDLGDSDELEIGDLLHIFGYPGIGGDTITLTSGNVSGFTREQGVSGRAWIKTDATIAGGNSGGTAVDENGVLVGVPTQGGSGTGDQYVDCRYIADTNGDGVIDENDSCVPMGGFINALRPVNVAKPMIEAARRGLSQQPTPVPTPAPTPTGPAGKAAISRIIFAPAINDADQPVSVVNSFPAGTEEIYLVFDYENLQDGASWQPVLIYNGQTFDDIWPVSGWSGGQQGTWWLSIFNEPLADGTYEFLLYYDGQKMASAKVTVGGRPQSGPVLSNIAFSGDGTRGYLLPAGAKEVKATFDYTGMTRQTKWSYTWYYEGKKTGSGSGTAFTQAAGQGSLSLTSRTGLSAGNYRLELYVENKLAATADFVVGGKSSVGAGSSPFDAVVFAEDVDRQGNPLRTGTAFKSGLTRLYAFFDYHGMQDGIKWSRRWYIDGEMVVSVDDTWQGGESGNWWVSINNGSKALPEGRYTLELLVEGQVVRQGACTIGASSAPPPTPTPVAGDVEVYGRIADANTRRGIQGALFIVLKPGVTVDTFQWTDEEVYSYGEADRNGDFELPLPLVRGETYSMIFGAKGYDMIAEDNVYVPPDIQSPVELNISLQKTR